MATSEFRYALEMAGPGCHFAQCATDYNIFAKRIGRLSTHEMLLQQEDGIPLAGHEVLLDEGPAVRMQCPVPFCSRAPVGLL